MKKLFKNREGRNCSREVFEGILAYYFYLFICLCSVARICRTHFSNSRMKHQHLLPLPPPSHWPFAFVKYRHLHLLRFADRPFLSQLLHVRNGNYSGFSFIFFYYCFTLSILIYLANIILLERIEKKIAQKKKSVLLYKNYY